MSSSLQEHLLSAPTEVSKLILIMAEQAKKIRKGFLTYTSFAGSKNVYGEEQLELDKWADKLILSAIRESGLVKSFASEEQSGIISLLNSDGNWAIAIDPLDGVSCVATNLSVGTIVAMNESGNVLEPGKNLDAALFVLYGPLTTLTYAIKNSGVHEFVFEEKKNEFILRKEDIRIPSGSIYGSGGIKTKWVQGHKNFIEELESQSYKVRFSGSFTADFNQVLYYGGLFCYPALVDSPQGKFRLLFEANPMAFIAKEAGGASTNGQKSILEIIPQEVHQRTPLYIGGKKEIGLAEKFLKK